MKKLIDLVKKIESDGYEISSLVIVDKEKKKGFIELVQEIKKMKTFEDFKNRFKIDEKILNYMKIYCTTEEKYKTFILFNTNLYKDNPETKKDETIINFNILTETEKTNSLINYIKKNDTFISKFINKQNRKSKVMISALRNNLLGKPEIKLKNYDKNSEFSTKEIIENKNNFTVKQNILLTFDLEGEILKNNIRIVLPNKFILYLTDSSYVSKTQIIFSNVMKLGEIVFNNYLEKINKFDEIYENVFGEKMENVEFRINIKKKNINNLNLDSLFIKKIENLTVTKNNINMRCLVSLEDYEERLLKIKEYEKIINEKKNILSELEESSYLLYDKEDLENIFKKLFVN